jgi:hemerythrin-like domain-containing protein
MRSTEILSHEHGVVLQVIGAAERAQAAMLETGSIDADWLATFLEFCSRFDEQCHEPKEEELLFPRLTAHGLSLREGLLRDLVCEHEAGHVCLQAMRDWLPGARRGDPEAIAAIAQDLAAYCELTRHHIAREESDLLPAAERLIDAEEQEQFEAELLTVEFDEIERGVQSHYFALAREIVKAR